MDKAEVQAEITKAQLHLETNEYDKALAVLKEALLSVERQPLGNEKPRLEIMMYMAEANHQLGEWVDALMYYDAVVQSSVDRHFSAIAAEALIQSGTILSKKGNWSVAMRKFIQADMLADSERLWGIKGKVLVNMGVIHWRQGEGEMAIQLATRAKGIGQEIDDHGLMGSALALMASVKFEKADFQGAVEANENALIHFREANELLEMSRVTNNLGETYKLMGNYEKAIEQFDDGLKVVEKTGVKRSIGYLQMNLAECHARKGEVKKAKLYANQTTNTIKDQEDVYLQAYLHLVWALIHDLEGKDDSTDKEYDAAISAMKGLGITFDTALFQEDYARALFKRDKKGKAKALFKEAIRNFKEAGSAVLAEQAVKELEEIA